MTLDMTPQQIKQIVCDYFGLVVHDFDKKSRNSYLVLARTYSMYFIAEMFGQHGNQTMTLDEIGFMHGKRDHATVLHAVKKVIKWQDAKTHTGKLIYAKEVRDLKNIKRFIGRLQQEIDRQNRKPSARNLAAAAVHGVKLKKL